MCFGSIFTFMRQKGRWLALLAALVGIAITGGAIFGSFDKVTRPTLYAPISGLCVLGLGFGVAFLTKGRTPASLHLADLAVNPELARLEPLQVTGATSADVAAPGD
jgi:hypothetical protein